MFAILVLPAWNGRYLNWHEERYQGDKKKVQLSELITLYNYTFIALLHFHSDLDGFSFFHVVDGLGDLAEAVVVLRDEDGRVHAALLHDPHHAF